MPGVVAVFTSNNTATTSSGYIQKHTSSINNKTTLFINTYAHFIYWPTWSQLKEYSQQAANS